MTAAKDGVEEFQRTLHETSPLLANIDSLAVTRQRDYASENPGEVFAEFRAARAETLALLRRLDVVQLERPAVFEGSGAVTLSGLVHFLCSHDQQHLSGLQWLLARIDTAGVST